MTEMNYGTDAKTLAPYALPFQCRDTSHLPPRDTASHPEESRIQHDEALIGRVQGHRPFEALLRHEPDQIAHA